MAATWSGSVSSRIVPRAVATVAEDMVAGTTGVEDRMGGTTGVDGCRAVVAVAVAAVMVGTAMREAGVDMAETGTMIAHTTVTMIARVGVAATEVEVTIVVVVAAATCGTKEVGMAAAMAEEGVEAMTRGLLTADLRAGMTTETAMAVARARATTLLPGTGAPREVAMAVAVVARRQVAIGIGDVQACVGWIGLRQLHSLPQPWFRPLPPDAYQVSISRYRMCMSLAQQLAGTADCVRCLVHVVCRKPKGAKQKRPKCVEAGLRNKMASCCVWWPGGGGFVELGERWCVAGSRVGMAARLVTAWSEIDGAAEAQPWWVPPLIRISKRRRSGRGSF